MAGRVARGDFGSHPDIYGRLWWDRPAVTIKRECGHIGNGRYAHPEQDRLCTVREMALLQGFPRDYQFAGTRSEHVPAYRRRGAAADQLPASRAMRVDPDRCPASARRADPAWLPPGARRPGPRLTAAHVLAASQCWRRRRAGAVAVLVPSPCWCRRRAGAVAVLAAPPCWQRRRDVGTVKACNDCSAPAGGGRSSGRLSLHISTACPLGAPFRDRSAWRPGGLSDQEVQPCPLPPTDPARSWQASAGAKPRSRDRAGSSRIPRPQRRSSDRRAACRSLLRIASQRVRLQDAGVELLVLIADYQAITDRTAPADLPAIVIGLMADYLAVGIDPARATIFAHSQVEPLNQLLLPFLSLVSVAEIGRNPTVKDEIAATGSGAGLGPDVHLSGPPGGRHPVLSREPGPCRPRSAAASRARPDHRAPVQRPVLPRRAVLPRA